MADTSKLFADRSDLYAQARPHYPAELFAFIRGLVNDTNTVWDCATGNGQAAAGLANIFDRVYATDISEEQIANHLDIENVEFSVCPAEQTEFADNMFDLVNVAQALHWFDLERFWPEVCRVLKPGGAFITYAYDWFTVAPDIDFLVESHIKSVVEPYWAEQNQLVINGYWDVDFPFAKVGVPDIDLQLSWNLAQMMNYLYTWSATRGCMEAQGTAFFEQAQGKIQQVWGDPSKTRTVTGYLTIVAGYPEAS